MLRLDSFHGGFRTFIYVYIYVYIAVFFAVFYFIFLRLTFAAGTSRSLCLPPPQLAPFWSRVGVPCLATVSWQSKMNFSEKSSGRCRLGRTKPKAGGRLRFERTISLHEQQEKWLKNTHKHTKCN